MALGQWELGLSRQALADRFDTSRTKAWGIENGQADLTLITLGWLEQCLYVAV